jgi:hypothetical protein
MPRNEHLKFREPVEILRAIGELTDESGNTFEILATGPAEEVDAFLENLPLHLEILPLEEAEEEQEYTAQDEPEKGYAEEPSDLTEEELAQSLVVAVRLVEVKLDKPFRLHFELDPPISPGPPYHHYEFTDFVEAYVKCTSTRGDADLHLYEWKCVGGLCEWEVRCRSTATTPVDECRCARLYTGCWHVKVTAKVDSDYTLTGDLNVT